VGGEGNLQRARASGVQVPDGDEEIEITARKADALRDVDRLVRVVVGKFDGDTIALFYDLFAGLVEAEDGDLEGGALAAVDCVGFENVRRKRVEDRVGVCALFGRGIVVECVELCAGGGWRIADGSDGCGEDDGRAVEVGRKIFRVAAGEQEGAGSVVGLRSEVVAVREVAATVAESV
jgi:hypothetical protein